MSKLITELGDNNNNNNNYNNNNNNNRHVMMLTVRCVCSDKRHNFKIHDLFTIKST